MCQTMKTYLAGLLAGLQLLCLLPMTVQAAGKEAPVLNPVIEGTVRFGSFSYTGDIPHERDGVDYVATYYYSDDYFSRSAVQPSVTGKVMSWSQLEDLSMATLSKDFTVSVYGSSEGSVPVDWTHKSKNGERFLADCGFTDVFVNSLFNHPTGRDTLGYIFGSKQITVWDARTQRNRSFTLVAIGVRGGGYGAEWASNITIGDPAFAAGHDKSASGTYRHKGFDDGAAMVLRDLDAYLAEHHIRGDVKYWVCGYSRSGAVANLVAGALTDNAKQYRTTIDDVYGYTYESAAAALSSEDPDGTRYPNIHNILNKLDLVPLVSPRIFGHSRLGVDYYLPYYGNEPERIADYFCAMRAVLPTVADLPDLYRRDVTGIEDDSPADPVITDTDPSVYPYDRTIQIKRFDLMNFANGFTQSVPNARSRIAPDEGLHLDEFYEQFVAAFLNSKAWDAPFFRRTPVGWNADLMVKNDWQSHERNYVTAYQEALRILAGDALKTPGKGFGSLGGIFDNAANILDLQTIFNAAGILSAYSVMDVSHGGLGYETAVGNMIDPMQYVVRRLIDELDLFLDEDLPEVHDSVNAIMPVLAWLFCEDHTNTNGEYLGTLADNFGNIFVSHNSEQIICWLMSLDDMFISDCREITVPKQTRVTLRLFRPGLDEEISVDGRGVQLAVVENGEVKSSKDDRVTAAADGSTVTIRYPGNADIRLDIQPLEGVGFYDMPLRLQDLQPTNVTNVRSVAERAENGNLTGASVEHDAMLTPYLTPDAQAINEQAEKTELRLSAWDTLHILARHGSNQIASKAPGTYEMQITAAEPPVPGLPFIDVPADAYFRDAVQWAYKTGVTDGVTETLFAPNVLMTRAQMVTFLWRAAGKPKPAEKHCPFTDVPADSYCADAVRWAFENGVTDGVTETLFAPDQTVTRAQMVTFLWRSGDCPVPERRPCPFTDVPAGSYYADAVRWAYQNGITDGVTETAFAPDQSVTRAQAVTFLYRFAKQTL